jgi:heptosyltransferase-1
MSEGLKNILIIKQSSLGDIVLALPALSALRRSFPKAKISWLVRTDFAPLLEKHPHLDEVIYFDRKSVGKAWIDPLAFSYLMALISKLRQMKFDTVFDFQGLFRTASLGWSSGCKNRFGMANAREFAHFFYTHKVQQNFDCIHLVDYYLKIIQTAGASDIGVEFILPRDPDSADSVSKLLNSSGIKCYNYAVFVIGSAHEDKCWPIERFSALAAKVSSQFGMSIVATGAAHEASVIERFKRLTSLPIANIAGHTSLGELVALLDSAKLVVSNDTGPGHIAAALGRPLVMIFGRSNPARVAPYGRGNCVAAIEPYSRGFKADSTNSRHNVKAITVDEVYGKVQEQLKLESPNI